MDVNRHADHTTSHVDKLDINRRAANNIFCFLVNCEVPVRTAILFPHHYSF